MEKQKTVKSIYEEITKRIVLQLASGDIPWRKGWISPTTEKTVNYVSRKPYHGINRILLDKPGEYMTFKQCEKNKGKIRKGSKGTLIVKYDSFIPKENKEEAEKLKAEGKSIEHLTHWYEKKEYVWHIDDCEGVETKFETVTTAKAQNPKDIADIVINDYCRRTGVRLNNASCDERRYNESTDTVTVPLKEQFKTEEEYYAAVFYGLMKSTAIEERCNRKTEKDAKEELINEIGASMVLNGVGLEHREAEADTRAACQKWAKMLDKDYRIIISAASQAEKAAAMILKPIMPAN